MNRQNSKYEWLRIITPLLITGVAVICWTNFRDITTVVSTLAVQMASVQAEVHAINDRLIRDENLLDSKKVATQ